MTDEGLSAEGVIEVTAKLNGFIQGARDVQNLDESLGGLNKEVSRVADLMRPAEDAAKRLLGSMKDGGSAARAEAADFATLTNQLRDFIKAHRDAAQLGVVNSVAAGTTPNGVDRTRLEAMSTAELQKFIAIDDARGVNAVSVARQIIASREREVTATETAVAASIKAVERESAAFTAAYTAELNTALRVDAEISASQQARRYAVPQNASRNVASPVAFAAAQQDYAAQETRAFSAAMKEQEGVAKSSGQGITSLAYSLFNLSFMAGAASTALLAMDVATVKAAVDYQSQFANVARTAGTTGAASDLLKESLIELSTTIPVSFEDITKIATLGGQLDIAASDLDNFTSTVAMFSATSNVATEAAATGLGRLGQLLPDVQGNYEALASSILKVGVNSVATESEIIAISTQIAGIASAAGLSASEVIGLSGALASVGIQPELSRGLITRLFTNIQVAIAQGGSTLEDFGKISGQTGAEFAKTWEKAPTQALLSLLSGIDAQGDGAIGTLKSLGIASVRDIPAIQKLAQSHQLLNQTLNDGKTGYEQQTELTRQFGVIADTVASRLTVLQNHFKEMLDAAGSSATGPLVGIIDTLDGFLNIITKISTSPAGQVFSIIGITAVAFIGTLLGVTATAAITAAGFLLMSSAIDKSNLSAERGILVMKLFKGAMIGTGIGALVVALGSVVAGVMALNGAFDGTKDKATEYFGSLDTLTTAMRADQKTYEQTGKSIANIATEQGTATVKADDWVRGLHDATGAQVDLNDNTSHTTDAIKKQTVAYGENAKAALANLIANNPDVQKKFADPNFQAGLKKAGGNFTDFLSAVYGDPVNGANNYIAKLRAAVKERIGDGGGGIAGALNGVSIADQKAMSGALGDLAVVGDAVTASVSTAAQTIEFFNTTAGAAGESTHNLADGATDAGGQIVTLGQQIQDNIDRMYEGVNAQIALQNSTEALGEAFTNDGAAAASQGAELQKVISDILATSASDGDAANALQGFFDALVKGGFASAQQLSILQGVIASLALSSGKPVVAAAFDMTPFVAGQHKAQVALEKTARSAAGAKKEIRTLVDYANDLQGVFSRSFDLRFGGMEGLDSISSGWSKIRESIATTNDEIRKYRDDMATLTADKAVKQYWLSVAENYGDALRAGELRAELGEIDTDLAKNSKDLAKAQEKNSKTLVGNTDAAIDNRSELTGLVKNYEGYITSLAASGMSQAALAVKTAQLKADFIAQARQLGFNEAELGTYANAFDDVATAIAKLPRNITVAFDGNPALLALNEFMAKARNIVGGGVGAVTPQVDDAALAKASRGMSLLAEYNSLLNSTGSNKLGSGLLSARAQQIKAALASGNYWNGGLVDGEASGYTGDGGKYEPKAFVHGGEYVFTKEQTSAIGVRQLDGIAAMAFSHNMSKGSTAPTGSAGSFAGSGGVTELSQFDRSLLMLIADRIGLTVSGTALQRVAGVGIVNSSRLGGA